jgi:hypothetical protein
MDNDLKKLLNAENVEIKDHSIIITVGDKNIVIASVAKLYCVIVDKDSE